MRQRKSSIIALICIAVYIAALGMAAYRIIAGIGDHRHLAEREFDELAEISSAAGALGLNTEPFKEAVRDALMRSRTLQGVIVSGPGGINHAFEREPGRAIGTTADIPRFKVAFGLSHEPFFRPLGIDGYRNVTISALPSSIDYENLIVILKFTLIPILGALVTALVTLTVESLRAKPALADEALPADDASPADEAGLPFGEAPFGEAEPDTAPGEGPAPDEAEAGEEAERSLPPGILGEDRAGDRLAAELNRCAARDQDMIFAVMEFRESPRFTRRIFTQFVQQAVEYFAPPDQTPQASICERGERGISLIIPDSTLEQIFPRVGVFHDQVLESLGPFFEKTDFCIGISSRAERVVDADRIALEAQSALEKALEDPESPIVAFKSDPEKYRTFMASQNPHRP